VWLELIAGSFAVSTMTCAAGWLRARRRLAEGRKDQKQLEESWRVLDEERRILELVAKGAALKEVLDALTVAIERMAPGCLCSILLLDDDRRHLLLGSAPTLPADFVKGVHGLEIGPDVGSCGSAAFRNETVIVEDIATDHRWAAAKDWVMSFGLRACWSVPVRDSERNVLGTFAMYHRHPATPRPLELHLVEAGAHLAGNAIERLRAEQRLRENAERMALAEKAAMFGIWELDLATDTLTISEGLALMLGIADGPVRLSADQVNAMIHPDDRETVRVALEQAIAGREKYEAEFRILTPDGSVRWERSQGRVELAGDQPKKLIGALIDITEQRETLMRLERAREAAETAVKAKSAFLANMSHEIRTPMNGIIGSITLLVDGGVTEEQQEYIGTIKTCSESLLQLVNDILDLSKIEAGKLTLEQTPFDLETLMKDALAVVAPAARAQGLDLRQTLDKDLPGALVGDPQRLRQVLLNLLSNAVKFTEHGHVEVRVLATGRSSDAVQLEFSVEDTGIGIPAEVQQSVLEPFTQGDNSTTRRFGGTGLGLAICSRLIDLMGGRLELRSEPGQGSTFRFTAGFAVAAVAGVLPGSSQGSIRPSTRRLRILLAEDNAVNQFIASRLLERMGHHVDVVADGRQAVTAVERADYDVVLMDCQMPNMDGYAATRAIRSLNRGRAVPIIAMTANAMAEERQRCLDAGMDDYLAKPVSAEQLYDALEGLPTPLHS
jgi:PAS domain S-box-containing protein